MLTDDPGTPGDKRIELNVAVTLERTPHERSWDWPVIDLNYGVGDRIQLNLQTAVVGLERDGSGPIAGLGSLAAAVKWRFVDEQADGISISIFPRIERNVLRSSVLRGLVEAGVDVLLPVEIARSFGRFSGNVEVGSNLRTVGRSEWFYGVVGGVAVSTTTNLMAELHGSARSNFEADRLTLNFGVRQQLAPWVAFIGSLGHDVRAPNEEPLSLVGYCGVQLQF